jgi:predicted N-acetyltransferase YhbS
MSFTSGIEFSQHLTVEEYNHLRVAVGWQPVANRLAQNSLHNALFMTVAREDGHPVGMARVLGDGGYILYIADVIVLPTCQRAGIGTRMMEKVMTFIDGYTQPGERVFVNLMAAAGKEPFYTRFGFTVRPDEGALGAGMSMYCGRD